MEFKKALIHQTPEEQQAYNTAGTTEAVKDAHETLKDLAITAKSHATTSDMAFIADQLEELKNTTSENHPRGIEEKLNDSLDKLDDVILAVKNIPETKIPEHPPFPELPITDLTKLEKLLEELVEDSKQPCVITLKLK